MTSLGRDCPGAPAAKQARVSEEKIDGWRIVAYNTGADVQLVSRTGAEHTPFADLTARRGVTWLEPRLKVEVLRAAT